MPSSIKTVIALNGFLGRKQDWSLIEPLLPNGWVLETVDVWSQDVFSSLSEWSESFTEQIKSENEGTKVILGYSMGGRLALHALTKAPKLFQGAVIVSANPGLLTDADRNLRVMTDEVWSSKFLKDPWDQLIREWNSQTALRPPKSRGFDFIELQRAERDFDRHKLSQVLRSWSLGVQQNLRSEIAKLPLPIEFVTGQDDVKFTSFTRDMLQTPAAGERSHSIVSDAGHRVPWDAPVQFRAILAKFLSRW